MEKIYDSIRFHPGQRQIYTEIDEILSGSPDIPLVVLKNILFHLWEHHRIRFLVCLDNIDKFHYKFEKYAYFEEYRKLQISNIFKHLGFIPRVISDGSELGNMGLCFLIACRLSTYKDSFSFDDERPNEETGLIFQIKDVNTETIIDSRRNLYGYALENIENSGSLVDPLRSYRKSFEIIKLIIALNDKKSKRIIAEQIKIDENQHSTLKSIYDLSHQGDRDFVSFLSNLRLDYQYEPNQIEELLTKKRHILRVLYMSNFKRKYSENNSAFPNIFLNDSENYFVDQEFRNAHSEHIHTYWLRYLILKILDLREPESINLSSLVKLLTEKGQYCERLVLLTLGILSETNKLSCIRPILDEKKKDDDIQYIEFLRLTPRGKRIVSDYNGLLIPLCFTFDYLQLIVDDNLMYYPSIIYNDIFKEKLSLDYLYKSNFDKKYQDASREYLDGKMSAVLAFLRVLDASYNAEKLFRAPLFNEINNTYGTVDMDFENIRSSVFRDYERMLYRLDQNERDEIVDRLAQYDDNIAKTYDLKQIFLDYFSSNESIPFNSNRWTGHNE